MRSMTMAVVDTVASRICGKSRITNLTVEEGQDPRVEHCDRGRLGGGENAGDNTADDHHE